MALFVAGLAANSGRHACSREGCSPAWTTQPAACAAWPHLRDSVAPDDVDSEGRGQILCSPARCEQLQQRLSIAYCETAQQQPNSARL